MHGTTDNYEIRVSGRLGATMLAAFPELNGEECGSDTVLTGEVRDSSALYGIVARLEALGLEIGERTVDALEYRRPKEQPPDICRLAVEHLGDEVVRNRAVAPGECRYELIRVRVPRQ